MKEILHLFTEHAPPGSERKTLLGTVDLDDRDEMDPPVTVYYYIVGGNEEGNFELDSLIHEVTVNMFNFTYKLICRM